MSKEKNLVDKRYNKIIKNNEFIEGTRSTFTHSENRLICYILSKVPSPKFDLDDGTIISRTVPRDYIFDLNEYAEVCNLAVSGELYESIKKGLKKLRDTSFWVEMKNGRIETMAWLSKVIIDNSIIKYQLDERILPFIDDQYDKGGYTGYCFINVLNLAKKNKAIPLYELLRSYEYRHKYVVSIHKLKEFLQISEDSYYSDFKRLNDKMLKPIVASINKYTDINVQYNSYGKPVHSIEFYIYKKKPVDILIANSI